MTAQLTSAIVRIRQANERVVGTGFLVSDKHILTCAHVINAALGRQLNVQEEPNQEIHLDFPLVASGKILRGRVVHWISVKSTSSISSETGADIALLELEDSLPEEAKPIRLVKAENLWKHPFRVFGFPEGQAVGVWTDGIIKDEQGNGRVQIEVPPSSAYHIEPGFSGSPVWDEQLDGVAGMTVAIDPLRPESRAAFMTPTTQLINAFPELKEQAISPSILGIGGYSLAKNKSKKIASALSDISVLIGERGDEPIELDRGNKVVPGLGMANEAIFLSRLAKDIQQGVFRVIFLGNSNNGKSTLINALLGDKFLERKRFGHTTAIISVVRYAKSNNVTVYETDKKKPLIFSMERFIEEFKLDYSDFSDIENQRLPDKVKNVNYANLDSLSSFCGDGIKLIDTPGFIKCTEQFINNINFVKNFQPDAIIYVLNSSNLYSLPIEEQSFIQTILREFNPNKMFFVCTLQNNETQEKVDEIRSYTPSVIKNHFVDSSGNFDKDLYCRRFFFVNAEIAMNARTESSINIEKLKNSNILCFEKELEEFLTNSDNNPELIEFTVQVIRSISGLIYTKITESKNVILWNFLTETLPITKANRNIKRRLIEKIQAAERDKERLDKIERKLLELFNTISELSQKTILSPIELSQLPDRIFND